MGQAAKVIEFRKRPAGALYAALDIAPPQADLTWREVMACHKWYGIIDKAEKQAREAGYRYFEWNGRVYCSTDDGCAVDTGILASEVR